MELCNPPCPAGEKCDRSGNCVTIQPVGTTNMVAPINDTTKEQPLNSPSVISKAPNDSVSNVLSNNIVKQTNVPLLPSVLGKIGIGFGIPYGVLGFGGEIGAQYFSVVGGIGTMSVISDPGWSIGGRVYVLNSTHRFRPHLTVVYGTTVAYSISGAVVASGALNGMGIFLGGDHDIGKIGGFVLTYGIGYITHEDFPQSVKDALAQTGNSLPDVGTPVKICVGINYRFGG